MITRPPRPPSLHGGISSSFLVPAPQSAFENLSTIDLRAPFHCASKWKKKREQKAKNEGKKRASNGKRTFSGLVPWLMQRAKNGEGGPGLTVIKQRRGAVMQTKGMWKGSMMKRFLKSSCTPPPNSTSFSSSTGDRDDCKLPFTQTFNPTDEDSSPNYVGFKEGPSDFSCESSNQTRIGKWGAWDLDEMSVVKGKVTAREKSRGFLKFMSWASIQGYSKLDKRRSQKMSTRVCHDVANDLENLQLEQCKEKAHNCSEPKAALGNAEDQREVQSSANTSFGDKKPDGKLFGFYKRKILTRFEGGKLGMKCSQNKQLSAPNSEGYIAHNYGKNTNQEELKSNKAADSTGLKQLMPFASMSKRNGGRLKGGLDEAVKVNRSGRSRAVVQTISSESTNHSTEFVISTGRAGAIHPVATQSKLRPLDLEESFSRLSPNDYPFTMRSNLHETNSIDLTSLNAKMDMRFEQVLTAIDIVAGQVIKGSAQSQPKTCIMVDDESIHSRLMSSRTSDLGTVEMEFSPFKNYASRSQLLEVPITKEFKRAVDDAHLKIRVLAGLLTVEKDAKMASARDFQSKRMILTMGMMGAQMLEGELLLEKPWHIKYLLDYCVGSIFFNGPHSSCHCICSRGQSSFSGYYKSVIFDSFCNDIGFTSMTFDSFCDEATRAMEELSGSMANGWSDALTNMFWNCAVCCFQVHKLIVAVRKCEQKVQILHPNRDTSFDAAAMDPLDTGNFEDFHKKVLFTIFSGFMLEGKVLCESQVYLEPKMPAIIL